MYTDETLEPVLWRIEGWMDRWPWLSRYYSDVMLPTLGLSSAWSILMALALHVAGLVLVVLLLAVYVITAH